MQNIFDTVVLIPSLHPDHLLPEYVDALQKAGFHRILIVDDGSGPAAEYQNIFSALNQPGKCTVIGYPENHGKGYALRYGMDYILKNFPDAPGVVTADSDGQHTAHDVEKIAESLLKQQNALILGSRNLLQDNVPVKSRFGNRMTSFFYALLYGQWLPDTQTGLRGFALSLIPFLQSIPGDRFEYEMNMLIYCSGEKIPFEIVSIDTIYLQENKGTHFRAFHDSMRIYKQLFGNFFRYASASIVSFVIDIGIFYILDTWVIANLLPAFDPDGYVLTYASAIIARIFSSVFNYMVNRRYVFDAKKDNTSAIKYFLLCVACILVSAGLTNLLHLLLKIDKTLLKALIDTVLYFINYRIQKAWVFKPSHK